MSEWLTLMPGHILLAARNVLCSAEGENKRNICRLVRIDVPHLLCCVFLWMACWVPRLSFCQEIK